MPYETTGVANNRAAARIDMAPPLFGLVVMLNHPFDLLHISDLPKVGGCAEIHRRKAARAFHPPLLPSGPT